MKTPNWNNECNHKPEEFIGTCWTKTAHPLDVYVFSCCELHKQVCIRFGNEGREYFSPGYLDEFLKRKTDIEEYNLAKEMIENVRASKT